MIVPMADEHVDAVARLHCASLKGLAAALGLPAVRAFYTGCVRAGTAAALVDVEDGIVLGYVLGATHGDAVKRDAFRHNPMGILGATCLGIVKRPASLAWLAKSFRGPDEGTYDSTAAELTYLVVAAERRTAGAGRRLVEAFSSAMREAGATSYELSVDDDNLTAIAFYERLGFRPVGRYREFGIGHCRYRLELNAA